ncbi:MAG: hypothetical protein ACKVOM_02385 [Ferruginibacter sp.]
MEGDHKGKMYDLLPEELYPTIFNILPEENFVLVSSRLQSSSINYPFIVKPDIGGQGILFRKIDDEAFFKHYH